MGDIKLYVFVVLNLFKVKLFLIGISKILIFFSFFNINGVGICFKLFKWYIVILLIFRIYIIFRFFLVLLDLL